MSDNAAGALVLVIALVGVGIMIALKEIAEAL